MRKIKTRTRYKIVGSDYSAQEPRLTAFMSNCPAMIQAYKEGKDLYCVIAASMFNNKYEENLEFYPAGTEIELDGKKIVCGNKTHLHKAGKERRSAAKTMLLAILYGMSAKTAGERMGKTEKEGQELMDNFFRTFPEVKQLIADSQKMLKEKGYVEDWAGRRRHLGHEYNLPPYEVTYLTAESKLANTFNPFFGCDSRPAGGSEIRVWNKIIEKYTALANEHQKERAIKEGREWKGSTEMGNKTFEWLQKIAMNPTVEGAKNSAKSGKGKFTNAQKILRDTGCELPEIPVLLIANTGRIAKAERECLNARIQGGAASLTKYAMVQIYNDKELNDLDAHLIITVHDEVLVECPAAYADQVEKRLPEVMVDSAAQFITTVPMKCDPYNVTRWYCDEAAVSVQDEFKKLEKQGMSRDEALAKVCANHTEIPAIAIRKTIAEGCDLDF